MEEKSNAAPPAPANAIPAPEAPAAEPAELEQPAAAAAEQQPAEMTIRDHFAAHKLSAAQLDPFCRLHAVTPNDPMANDAFETALEAFLHGRI